MIFGAILKILGRWIFFDAESPTARRVFLDIIAVVPVTPVCRSSFYPDVFLDGARRLHWK